MRIHAIPHSTNVHRVALALGLKGVAVDEWVQHTPEDRTGVRAVSGQDLVPVLETDDGQVLVDSMPIVAWIDQTWPEPPLYPADPAARREVEGFITFFNQVWKVAPNAIDAEQQRHGPAADAQRIAAWAAQLRGWQHGFDGAPARPRLPLRRHAGRRRHLCLSLPALRHLCRSRRRRPLPRRPDRAPRAHATAGRLDRSHGRGSPLPPNF